jgi:hypothetical protein
MVSAPRRKHASKTNPRTKSGCSDVAKAAGGLDLNDGHRARPIGDRKEKSKKLQEIARQMRTGRKENFRKGSWQVDSRCWPAVNLNAVSNGSVVLRVRRQYWSSRNGR